MHRPLATINIYSNYFLSVSRSLTGLIIANLIKGSYKHTRKCIKKNALNERFLVPFFGGRLFSILNSFSFPQRPYALFSEITKKRLQPRAGVSESVSESVSE